MGTSNIDQLIVSLPESSDIEAQQCKSSSSLSQTPNVFDYDNQVNQMKMNDYENLASYGCLKIQVSSSVGDKDDPKTPKSTEHRIPVMVTCPPAPRKAKRVLTNGKRKVSNFLEVRVLADFMVYVDAMLALNRTVYVPDIVVGDLGTGDNTKRLKPLPPPAQKPN